MLRKVVPDSGAGQGTGGAQREDHSAQHDRYQ